MKGIIATAFAATGNSASAQPNPIFNTLLMLGIFIVFIYFLIWRPQSKRAKQHNNMINSIKEGDEIATSGGLIGKIISLDDTSIGLNVADNVVITLQRNAISQVLPKGSLKHARKADE